MHSRNFDGREQSGYNVEYNSVESNSIECHCFNNNKNSITYYYLH